ncbi:hypothetical protein FRC10_006153 [Ceratobasidium sp. 414]|nr:hypothetical protein FRC10_006153 [Ceratobasidium sp. 414]
MPRPARRPAPIALSTCPMDTLWEVDESAPDAQVPQLFTRRPGSAWFIAPKSTTLRSIFEDDDEDDLHVSFPLPPVSLPSPVRRMFTSPRPTKQRPVCSPPRRSPAPVPFPRVPSPSVTPPRRRAEARRPVSPASSASSSDTEPPRTPPAASAPLPPAERKPAYILAPPPPAEWESAIDALFAFDYESDQDEFMPRSAPIPIPPRRAPPPPPPRSRARPRSPESYLSYSPVSSPGPLSLSQLPMSPTFARALASPGFMPTSPNSDNSHSSRPARPIRRFVPERATIPVELLLRS